MPHPKRLSLPQQKMTSQIQAGLEAVEPRFQPVFNLARSCDYDVVHTDQVTKLALQLFDDLQSLHQLGSEERFWLAVAATLHDIGWIEGWHGHHKASLRIILETPMLSFSNKERLLIGSIARYHRGSLPHKKHDHYQALSGAERKVVLFLAAILRLADGLDRTHQALIRELTCQVTAGEVRLFCRVQKPAEDERNSAGEKGDLFTKVYKRKVSIAWSPI
jgi:exopolyphosphatase/pppGpp-phosphohydrolase